MRVASKFYLVAWAYGCSRPRVPTEYAYQRFYSRKDSMLRAAKQLVARGLEVGLYECVPKERQGVRFLRMVALQPESASWADQLREQPAANNNPFTRTPK